MYLPFTYSDSIQESTNKFCAIIPGLMLGFTEHNLKVLDSIANEIRKIDDTYRFPIFITTWEVEWNMQWVEGIKRAATSYSNIELHIFTEDYNSPEFISFVEHFLYKLGLNNKGELTSNFFKALASFYIKRIAFENAKKMTLEIDDTSIWSGFKFNSYLILSDFISKSFLSLEQILKHTSLFNTASFDKKTQYYMNGPLDCMIFPHISSSSIKENYFYCSIDSAQKVFRFTSEDLADDLAKFYLSTIDKNYHNRISMSSFYQLSISPRDSRTEGSFLFKYLVETASPHVPYTTNIHLFQGFKSVLVRSPSMYFIDGYKLKIKDSTELISQLKQRSGIEDNTINYVLSEQEYSNLDYFNA